jgi:polyisoprenyl-phosphate glycosyltransferase
MGMPDVQPQTPGAQEPAPQLSLVIPCYDEERNLPLLIQRLEDTFAGRDAEVILVDNGSTDGTPAVMATLAGHQFIRSIRVEINQGYGYGILAGLRVARGALIGWTHADMQTDPADAVRALDLVPRGSEASVYLKGRRHGRPFSDVVFTLGMALFETILLRAPMWDINAQPNIIPRAFFEDVGRHAPSDFSLDLYFYYQAKRRGLRFVRFPVVFGPRVHGVSHWNVSWASKRKFIERTLRFSLELRSAIARGAR